MRCTDTKEAEENLIHVFGFIVEHKGEEIDIIHVNRIKMCKNNALLTNNRHNFCGQTECKPKI